MLNRILATALLLWLASLLLRTLRHHRVGNRGHQRGVPRGLAIIASAVLAFGWAMTLNARSIYDSDFFLFISRRNIFPWAPGSVDAAISTAWMLRATLLIGVIFLVVNLAQDPKWVLRLWWTIALAGASIALLGLLQKATGAERIFWQTVPEWERVKFGYYDRALGAHFFAAYYYHGNAGAYLNLIVPPALGLMRPRVPIAKAVSLILALLAIAAVAANTSRMAQLIGLILIVSLLVSFVRSSLRRHGMVDYKSLLLGSAIVVFTLFAIARVSHLDQPLKRWHELSVQLPADARWLASRAALRALGDASWFGFGPGTFRVIFPYYTSGLGPGIDGTWRFLHEDYLQTLLEWGRLGAVLWGLLFFGGILVAIRNLLTPWRTHEWLPRQRRLLPTIVLALFGIALHSLVDFPLQIASLQLYVAVYLGICWGSTRWDGTGEILKKEEAES